MLEVHDFSAKIFANSKAEVDVFVGEFMAFVREQRAEGRAVTAEKLTSALKNLKNSPLIKTHINNHFK